MRPMHTVLSTQSQVKVFSRLVHELLIPLLQLEAIEKVYLKSTEATCMKIATEKCSILKDRSNFNVL